MTDFRTDPRARGLGEALLRLPIFVLCWLLLMIVWIPLFLAGLVVVPVLAHAGAYHVQTSPKYAARRLLQWRPRWAWIFGNLEDGIDGLRGRTPHELFMDPTLPQHWWWLDTKGDSKAQRIIRWSAWRNSVNNFRFTRLIDFHFEPERLRWFANSEDCSRSQFFARAADRRGFFYLFAWHGWRSQLWILWLHSRTRHFRIRIGAKAVMPRMRSGIPPDHYLSESESWTPMQFSIARRG